jgi:hypothetical protein
MVNYSISATSLLAITSGIATVNAAEQQQSNNLRQSKQEDTSTQEQQRKLITLRYGDTEEEEYHGPSAGSSYLPSGYNYEPSAPHHSDYDKIDFIKPVADAGHDQWTSDGWEKKHSSSSSKWSSDGWGKKEHHGGASWKCDSNLLKVSENQCEHILCAFFQSRSCAHLVLISCMICLLLYHILT